jgi:hypothetical protein
MMIKEFSNSVYEHLHYKIMHKYVNQLYKVLLILDTSGDFQRSLWGVAEDASLIISPLSSPIARS